MVCQEINDMFRMNGTTVSYKQCCYKQFEDNYEEYICILKTVLCYLELNYEGDKNTETLFKKGRVIDHSGIQGVVEDYHELGGWIVVKKTNGETEKIPKYVLEGVFGSLFSYSDRMNAVRRDLSLGYRDFYRTIFEELSVKDCSTMKKWCDLLSVDYTGYGHVQFSKIHLDKNIYGSENADEYVSKAYPALHASTFNTDQKEIVFWRGDFPEDILKSDCFYIVRIETSFKIKEGEIPFVKYKERDFLRRPLLGLTNTYNLLQHEIILHTSDLYSEKDNKYYSQYKNLEGKICDATVKLTLTKGDFELFKERHYIRTLKILDGCYFR